MLLFPIFNGLSKSDLEDVIAHTKFDFFRLAPDERLVTEGDPCDNLLMMTGGRLEALRRSEDGKYSVEETLEAPLVVGLHRLFGLHQRHESTLTAKSSCSFISLSKEEFHRLISTQTLCRVNYLNMLSLMAQRVSDDAWRNPAMTDRERLTEFFRRHCQEARGPKTFRILMTRLSLEINAPRRDVSRELRRMEADGLVSLSRARIEIPGIEKL